MSFPIIASIKENIAKRGFVFLVCGGINTLFGYFGSVGLYELLKGALSVLVIIILTRIMTITFSFLTYKLFVFKTKKNWLKEYFRCYITYGFTSLIIMAVLYVMVELMGISFWLAQLVATAIGVICNFIAHSCFTFSSSTNLAQRERT